MTAALALLRGLPAWLWLVVALCAAVLVQSMRLDSARASLRAEQTARSADRARYAAVAASAVEANQTEEQRRTGAQQEIAHVAELAQARALDDRRTADTAGQRLQQRFAAVAASRCPAPADTVAAPGGPPASAPADLLAEVQRRIDEAAGQFADAADRARIAGLACEHAYDSLTERGENWGTGPANVVQDSARTVERTAPNPN